MALPETIPVKYTEEEAEFVSIRPVVRQVFRADELVDMVLGVTGKDVSRIQQILRSGTLVFHFYRYWWQGFEATAEDLTILLARFPDADPTRAFRAEECTAVLLEGDATPGRGGLAGSGPPILELERGAASRKRLLRTRSVWDALMALATSQHLEYQDYSYARRADLFALHASDALREMLRTEAGRLARKALQAKLSVISTMRRIVFVCPRRPERL